MHLLDLTLDSLADNLALDEALLIQAEEGGPEVLRLWQWPPLPCPAECSASAVVLGAGCKLADDVDEEACRAAQIPLARRGSGGGTVLLGPGCLLFSLILSFRRAADLQHVRASYAWILTRIIHALTPLGIHLCQAGTSDLIFEDRKVSGNAQQRKRGHLLHHGSMLFGFDAAQVERYLRLPSRRPAYRHERSHADFLGNLPASAEEIRRVLCGAWDAGESLRTWPRELVGRLVQERYGLEEWIRRR